MECNGIFSTIEAPDVGLSLTLKRPDGSLEPFLRDKLLLSVYGSLKHRKSALADATALTATILKRTYELSAHALVERDVLVEITGTVLERFDRLSATHYRAFHPPSDKN